MLTYQTSWARTADDAHDALKVELVRTAEEGYPERRVDTRRILEDFERIAGGAGVAMQEFVTRYGPLPLCKEHFLPKMHLVMRQLPGEHFAIQTPCAGKLDLHPLPVYVRYAQEVRAARRIATAVREHQKTEARRTWEIVVRDTQIRDDLKLLDSSYGASFTAERGYTASEVRGRGDVTLGARWLVERVATSWLSGGELRPQFVWPARDEPSIHLTTNVRWAEWNLALWGVLARRLVADLMSGRLLSPLLCRGSCGGTELPRKSKPGAPAKYCDECRAAGIPSQLHSQAYRRRRAPRTTAAVGSQ